MTGGSRRRFKSFLSDTYIKPRTLLCYRGFLLSDNLNLYLIIINNHKTNILIWSSSFYPRVGGLETASYNIANRLINDKWNVQIITNNYPRTLSYFDVLNKLIHEI